MEPENVGSVESLESHVFKSLSNEKRREMVRYLGERKVARFNEMKRDLGFDDGAYLTYHFASLEPLLTQGERGYSLSAAGRDAYNLMRRISTFSSSAMIVKSVRQELATLIVVNAILWAAAILSVRLNEGTLQQATIQSFAALWFIQQHNPLRHYEENGQRVLCGLTCSG